LIRISFNCWNYYCCCC